MQLAISSGAGADLSDPLCEPSRPEQGLRRTKGMLAQVRQVPKCLRLRNQLRFQSLAR